jgi:hypothetical protein
MMASETILEFLQVDSFWFLVGFNMCIPLVCSRSDQLMRSKQNLLTVVALDHLQLLLNGLQPIVGIHWLNRVRECRRFDSLKLSRFVTGLGLWRWLMPLSLLHVGHNLLHDLQHLSLHYQNLLKCWWWRQVGVVVVLVGTTIVSVGHLMIVKRFETKIDIAIRDSQLYASRYIDD